MGRREIARAFNIKGAHRIALKQYLRQLVAEGSISLAGRKRVSAPGNLPPVTVLEVLKITGDTDKAWKEKIESNVVITTWQSVYKQPKAFYDQFGVVIGDEAHLFKAVSLYAKSVKDDNDS